MAVDPVVVHRVAVAAVDHREVGAQVFGEGDAIGPGQQAVTVCPQNVARDVGGGDLLDLGSPVASEAPPAGPSQRDGMSEGGGREVDGGPRCRHPQQVDRVHGLDSQRPLPGHGQGVDEDELGYPPGAAGGEAQLQGPAEGVPDEGDLVEAVVVEGGFQVGEHAVGGPAASGLCEQRRDEDPAAFGQQLGELQVRAREQGEPLKQHHRGTRAQVDAAEDPASGRAVPSVVAEQFVRIRGDSGRPIS